MQNKETLVRFKEIKSQLRDIHQKGYEGAQSKEKLKSRKVDLEFYLSIQEKKMPPKT